MSCSYFKNKYDAGFCSASHDIHIPGINEMSRFCFKADYTPCPIFYSGLAETGSLTNVRRAGDCRHANHKARRFECFA